MTNGDDDAPAAEPWVQDVYERWAQTHGIEILLDAEASQLPIDEYMWHVVGRVRHVLVEAQMRLSSRSEEDLRWLGGDEGRAAATQGALARIAAVSVDLIEAVGGEPEAGGDEGMPGADGGIL